jgi:hypothetical protein
MSLIQLGAGNTPIQTFVSWKDPDGDPLISINRDGTVTTQGVTYGDGTKQTTASSGGGSPNLTALAGFWTPVGDTGILPLFGSPSAAATITLTTMGISTAGTVYCFMFETTQSRTIGHVVLGVDNSQAATHINVGIANSSGTLLFDAGAISTASPVVVSTSLTSSIILPAGVYYLLLSPDTSSETVKLTQSFFGFSTQGLTMQTMLNTNANRIGIAANVCSGSGATQALPSTLGVITANNTLGNAGTGTAALPMIFFEP